MKPALLWLLVIGSASAGLTDYIAQIETPPCSDGWAECVVDGDIGDVMGQEHNGYQYSNNDRVDFWTFKPLKNLSPFASFSAFPDIVAEVEKKEEYTPPPQTVTKRVVKENTGSNDDDAARRRQEEADRLAKEEADRLAKEEADRLAKAEADRLAAERRRKEREAEATCAPIDELEDAAMLGSLDKKQSNCLEKELSSAATITDQRKISNILINNALSAKNWKQWERYTKRHLDKYDRSDANMCYGFAVYMFNKKRFSDAIVWSERGLEQKQRFAAGSDFKKKVYTLHKLKTMAANTIWQKSEEKLVSISNDNLREKEKVKAERYQAKTKNFAREWLNYARSSSQKQNLPMQICVSAATKSFCQ